MRSGLRNVNFHAGDGAPAQKESRLAPAFYCSVAAT
jgi:hypothetical protein